MSDAPVIVSGNVETTIEPAPPIDAVPRLDAFFSIPVNVEIIIASVRMPVSKLLEIQAETVIDLAHPAGAEVSLVVNGSVIAFGHLFLIDPKTKQVGVKISRLANNGEV